MPSLTTLNKYFYSLWSLVLATLGLAFALLTLTVIAQTPLEAKVQFSIQGRSSDQPLTVGDQLTFRLAVTHATEARVALPQVEREWGGFRVIEQSSPREAANNDGTTTTSKEIVVAAFQPGYYKTPSLLITHRKPDGVIEDLATPVIQIKVTSVITDIDDDELRDLKPQAALAEPSILLLVLGGLILLVVLGAVIAGVSWWVYRRRQTVPIQLPLPQPVIDVRPPEAIALAELSRIEALRLPVQQQWKEHYSLVSACMRQYLENRYKIAALEQTTTEINHALRKNSLPIGHVSGLMGLLHDSDLVKFARYAPNEELAAELLIKAREVIVLTTPTKKDDAVIVEKSV